MALSARRPALDPVVESSLRRLLPNGSNPRERPNWQECPGWPPDLFCVAAFLLERLGAYARPPFTFGWREEEFGFSKARADDVQRVGEEWRMTGSTPERVQARWQELRGHAVRDDRTYLEVAMWLLAVADEASAGMGFVEAPMHVGADTQTSPGAQVATGGKSTGLFAGVVILEHMRREREEQSSLPNLPYSLCRMVPTDEACVQPKTNVPSVGITLRSLSHHLAFLPPRSSVETEWLFGVTREAAHRPLNLLVVPFPYVVNGSAFQIAPGCADDRNCYFTVEQDWLRGADGRHISADVFYDFLKELVKASKREVRHVHGIVLPEGALPYDLASQVAEKIATCRAADGFEELELFISGVTSTSGSRQANASWTYTARFAEDKVLRPWRQKKHHRWRLDRGQIRRYQLGHVLDPDKMWWEQIDVSRRTCKFTVVRPGAALAVLVCEDLARSEPVMPVINAVGPNLLIALLMDGPQLESRWSSRYATVLADDPGCSVLTLTCRGMIRRSSPAGFRGPDAVALWKEYDGQATPLMLPDTDHGLIISLTSHREEQYTMDLRSDGGGTVRFRLSGVAAVRLPAGAASDWLRTH